MQKINTICVIDDDQIYHFTLSKLIEKSSLFNELLSFNDGEQALEFFKKYQDNEMEWPDVILLDINMPVIDGWSFLDDLAAMIPEDKAARMMIYMVSSSVDSRDIDKSKTVPLIHDYIVKPVTMDILQRIHDEYLAVGS